MMRVAITNRVRCPGSNSLFQRTSLGFKCPSPCAFTNPPRLLTFRGLADLRIRTEVTNSLGASLSPASALSYDTGTRGNDRRGEARPPVTRQLKPHRQHHHGASNKGGSHIKGHKPKASNRKPSDRSRRPHLDPLSLSHASSRQRWTKQRRREPRTVQLLHLKQVCEASSLPTAEAEFHNWSSKYDNYIASKSVSLPEPPAFLKAGRWLCAHDTTASMHEAWMALDEANRKEAWIDVMMATLLHAPNKAAAVLTATLDPLPPEYAVHDVLLFIAQRQRPEFFETTRHRIASANKIVELLEKVLPNFPKNNFFFSETPFAILASHLPCEYVDEIYDMLGRANIKLRFHTLMHFARRLASEEKYKRKALDILSPHLESGSTHPAMQSVITILLTYKPSQEESSSSEPPLTPENALQSLVERNYVPNLINLTAGLDGLCQHGEFEEAARLALLFAEENVKLDGVAAAKLFKGAKLSLRPESVRKAFDVARITSMPYVDMLNEGLHTVYYFATMESHDNGFRAPWTMPLFLPMLHMYSQRFQLGPLQRWFPTSLPLMLLGDGPAMESLNSSQWPLLNSVLPVVKEFFNEGSGTKAQPTSTTIATMLRAYIKSLQDPTDILRFYNIFKSQLEEGGPKSPFAKLIEEKGSLIHDTFIRAMMERPWSTRAGLQIFGDMLHSHVKRLENRSVATDTALPLHPAPSRFTFGIVISGLMSRGSVTLAEQMVQIMHEHGFEVDLPIWNTVIKGHAKAQDIKNTVAALRKMEAAGFGMNDRTFKAFGKLQNQKAALKIMERIIEENMQSMLDEHMYA